MQEALLVLLGLMAFQRQDILLHRKAHLVRCESGERHRDLEAVLVEPLDVIGGIGLFRGPDLAPKFYPVLSSPRLLDLPGWTVAAAGAGAEPSA